jgi:hypothetical protein
VPLLPGLAFGQFIDIRVSVKIITDPTTGNRPPGITDLMLLSAETNANQWMASYSRGYRFDIREIVNIGGPAQGGATGPSKWYGQDPRGTPEPWNTFQSDTLPEGDCWTRDQIAARWPTATTDRVDDTFFNVMSYHNAATKDTDENRMTELQLDRHADTANSTRAAFVSGRTRFVSATGNDNNTGLVSTAPKLHVLAAVNSANPAGGDIILLRPGSYNEQLTLDRPVTLRATRVGPATIGKP